MTTALEVAEEIINKEVREAIAEKLISSCCKEQAELFEDMDIIKKVDSLENKNEVVVLRIMFDTKKEEVHLITKKWVHKFSDFKLKPAGMAKFQMTFRAAADKVWR